MSDQQARPTEAAAAPVDSPETGADQTQEQVDWQKRFEDTQAAYTQGQQELKALQAQQDDLDYFRELAEKHGYQLEEEEDPDDTQFDDPSERVQNDLEQVKAYLAQQAQEQQQEQQLAYLEASVEQQLGQLPQGLSEKQKDWIVSRAIALPATQEGLPDIAAAHQEFEALRQEDQKHWAQSKRAPHISPNGRAGTQTKNVVDMTRQERQDWMAEQLAANEQQ